MISVSEGRERESRSISEVYPGNEGNLYNRAFTSTRLFHKMKIARKITAKIARKFKGEMTERREKKRLVPDFYRFRDNFW